MGAICCKNGERYVRQHDSTTSTTQVSSPFNREEEYLQVPTFYREESTKGSETELNGDSFPDYPPYYNTTPQTQQQESKLSKRFGRFHRRRRQIHDELHYLGERQHHDVHDHNVDHTEWLMANDAISTKGHQHFEKKKGEDSYEKNYTTQNKIELEDPYTVEYKGISTRPDLPPPPSQPTSPRKSLSFELKEKELIHQGREIHRPRFPFFRRRHVSQEPSTLAVEQIESQQFGRRPPHPIENDQKLKHVNEDLKNKKRVEKETTSVPLTTNEKSSPSELDSLSST